jgi:hypothetical protein
MTEDSYVWIYMFKKMGIPRVISKNKEVPRNYKEDFRVLYPITLSGRQIEGIFGDVIGKIPGIREEVFNELNTPDPFELEKLQRENYVVVVVPNWPHVSLKLNESKNLCVRDISYKINVFLMRRHVVAQGLSYAEQEGCVKEKGFEVASLLTRGIFDKAQIVTTGTCPDGCAPCTYARTSDTVLKGNVLYNLIIGGGDPLSGMRICKYCSASNLVGVAPCKSAEVV